MQTAKRSCSLSRPKGIVVVAAAVVAADVVGGVCAILL